LPSNFNQQSFESTVPKASINKKNSQPAQLQSVPPQIVPPQTVPLPNSHSLTPKRRQKQTVAMSERVLRRKK